MSTDKKQVLFVDDDVKLLQGLGRMLRPMRKVWNMEFAYGGPAGIEEIRSRQYDVVVSDMRMPEISGVDLLKEVSHHCPDSVRVVLSGEAKQDSVYQVLKYAHQYIAKPCDAQGLQKKVQLACDARDLLEQSVLKHSICNISVLGSSAQYYDELLEALAEEEPSLRKVSMIIASDLAMTVKVLQFANSAFFGGNNKVLDVFAATKILGIEVIRELCTRGHIVKSQHEELRENRGRLLNYQSLIVAKLAHAIALEENLSEKEAAQAYTAGLLHNLGLHILAQVDGRSLQEILDYSTRNNCWLSSAEVEVLGLNSTQLGAALLTLWGIPRSLSYLVENYNDAPVLERAEFDVLSCVYCAFHFCYGKENSLSDDEYLKSFGKEHKVPQWINLLADVLH
ncbi:MAG: HDOD domain-containing protein [Bdellovibrionales bacterium]|nr:HDOD domain-containing protein [Bdellovibrionales bacterium]